jgi:tetraacyldisaccharide 4'-kinase
LKAEAWRSITKPDERRDIDFFAKEEGVHAVAGIGHPERFFAMLRRMGIHAVTHAFADHHRFSATDLALPSARWILMTEQDAVKRAAIADGRCWYLPITGTIAPPLLCLIEETLRGSSSKPPAQNSGENP